MADFQVAVIGSGPIGLTLANLLGQLGVRTLLVERNAVTVQEPRAVSIDDESLRTLQACGLASEVMTQIVPGYGSHYYSPRRICFARVEPTGRPYGYPRRNAFRQPVLEAQLRAGLSRFGHVEPRYGTRLDRFAQNETGVALSLTALDGTAAEVTCDYLVGCDGAASTVREQLGIQLAGTTFDERWLIVDLENNENITKHTEVFCDIRRPCITLPGPNRTRRFEFKLKPGERDEELLAPETVQALLRDHGADPNATIRRKVVYRFHARVAPRWSEGRVFLAGDAAHLTPPFAGQGMNSGIRDAQNLAWKLAAVLDGRLGPALLDSYQQERRDHISQMVQLALRMGRVMSPKTWLHGFLTQTAFLALNIWPPARDYIAQMKYKPPPRFNEGFLVPDGLGRASLVGRLLPQPMVPTPDGEILLDEILGARFVLLAPSAQAAQRLETLDQPIWDRLGAARMAVPFHNAVLAPYQNHVLLLRPDNYVAASIDLDHPDSTAQAVASLLAGTFAP